MSSAPTFPTTAPNEEWADTEFDLPDGDPIEASDGESEKDDDEDWDVDLDLGKTDGANAHVLLGEMAERCVAVRSESLNKDSRIITIRPAIQSTTEDEDDDGEGISTIKISALPQPHSSKPPSTIDEDFEDDFVLPSDMTELSLRPASLLHRSSKSSMEWGEKDHTSSSQSSDAFSTFGFTDNSAPSSYTSASLPETETEDEDAEDILDGLVLPSALFESGQGAKRLAKLLEKKKSAFTPVPVPISGPDPEDDFEAGLVLADDMELSPSRLMIKAQQTAQVASGSTRSKSVPARAFAAVRPPSRLKSDRTRSSNYPPVSSIQQFRKLPAPPPSLLLPPASVRQTYSQALIAGPSSTSSGDSLSPKFGTLRTQKSHTGLKPASPPSTRRLARKASLPALSDGSGTQASGSGSSYIASTARYDAPTASSRAKVHNHSTSRISALDYRVPPTRPTTPSANPAALRLTLPTSSLRLKARAPISAIFPQSGVGGNAPPLPRSISPLPSSQQASAIVGRSNPSPSFQPRSSPSQIHTAVPAPKFLKRPKRLKTYGDGTELDGIEDLPLDCDKEGRYRVQPKGYGTRVPGSSFTHKDDGNSNTIKVDRLSLSRASKQDVSAENTAPAKTLKRTGHIGLSSKHQTEPALKKKRASNATKRKPTLIRNLGGTTAPKVVGDMKWNPQALRWEGNDQILRDFDAVVGTSIRPALITQLTGSSVGSPIGNFASGARVVGNMFFDPARMCWISTLPPEEDEPDVFADLADDEDDEWEAKGATIRPGQQSSKADQGISSPSRIRSKSMSETESDRCSRGSMVYDVEDGFVGKCRLAEERHRLELKGWVTTRGRLSRVPDRAYLYEIRALATRQY